MRLFIQLDIGCSVLEFTYRKSIGEVNMTSSWMSTTGDTAAIDTMRYSFQLSRPCRGWRLILPYMYKIVGFRRYRTRL